MLQDEIRGTNSMLTNTGNKIFKAVRTQITSPASDLLAVVEKTSPAYGLPTKFQDLTVPTI